MKRAAKRFMNQHGKFVIRGPAVHGRNPRGIRPSVSSRERRIEKALIVKYIQRHRKGQIIATTKH